MRSMRAVVFTERGMTVKFISSYVADKADNGYFDSKGEFKASSEGMPVLKYSRYRSVVLRSDKCYLAIYFRPISITVVWPRLNRR